MYARYHDRVDFYAIYIREAHPSDGWSMESNDRVGIQVAQPKSIEERTKVASQCCSSLDMAMPLLVDSIDDRVGRAYSGFPDRLYLIDRDGTVRWKHVGVLRASNTAFTAALAESLGAHPTTGALTIPSNRAAPSSP